MQAARRGKFAGTVILDEKSKNRIHIWKGAGNIFEEPQRWRWNTQLEEEKVAEEN